MGTRATIRFKDQYDKFYVYRGHDGYPENVKKDILDIIKKAKNRWSGSECGTFVTLFLASLYDTNDRLPRYELTHDFHGDESYKYYVDWDSNKNEWVLHDYVSE